MPTRYLKPGVRDSESIDSLTPLAETLFYRLLVTVDDFGRYDARAAMVKAHCFPIKDMTAAKCQSLLDELHSAGLLILYTVEGKPYLQMCKWDNVPRAKESKFPQVPDDCAQMHTSANAPHTNAPLTVTVTVTETETQTGNINREAPRKRSAESLGIEVFPPGLDVPSWDRWQKYRKQIGKPLKPASINAAQIALAKFGVQQADVVEQSIAAGWQGLFAVKGGSTNGNKQTALEERNKAIGDEWLREQGVFDARP